jgi:uncharacterized membrane protein YkvA (DUF1232 family)
MEAAAAATRLADDEAVVHRGLWSKVRRLIGRVPFLDSLLAAYYCAVDPRTPAYVKAVLMGALAYFVVPSDLIPDFIAGLGFIDDGAVLSAALAAVRGHITPAHRQRARDRLRALSQDNPAAAP